MQASWWLLAAAVLLALAASGVGRFFQRAGEVARRFVGILAGGLWGAAATLPLAIVLNPLVGMEKGSYHNLGILAICLGFLGFIVGSLSGLVYAGMILSPEPRIMNGTFEDELRGVRPASEPVDRDGRRAQPGDRDGRA